MKINLGKKIINGTITSIPINVGHGYSNANSCVIKLDAEIEGIPDELVVKYFTANGFYVRPGDKVLIQGKIYRERIKFWNKNFIWVNANHIFNQTLNCGF